MTLNPAPIVFTGSSIIAMWENLASFFPGETVINTAISGSVTADLLPQLDALVLAHRPRLVCYYCGSNDINNGVPPAQIAENVARSAGLLHARQPGMPGMPGLPFVYLSIIRAPQKAPLMDQVNEANARVARLAEEDEDAGVSPQIHQPFYFIDINPVFFDAQGCPRAEFYVEDGLHLTPAAYTALGAYLAPRVRGIGG